MHDAEQILTITEHPEILLVAEKARAKALHVAQAMTSRYLATMAIASARRAGVDDLHRATLENLSAMLLALDEILTDLLSEEAV